MPLKDQARNAVSAAVSKGALVRQPCEECGAEPTFAHHDDYSRPLDVRWLCRPCHSDHHRVHGFAEGVLSHWSISLRLPLDLKEPLRRAAAAEDRTIANLIVHALRLYLEGREKPE